MSVITGVVLLESASSELCTPARPHQECAVSLTAQWVQCQKHHAKTPYLVQGSWKCWTQSAPEDNSQKRSRSQVGWEACRERCHYTQHTPNPEMEANTCVWPELNNSESLFLNSWIPMRRSPRFPCASDGRLKMTRACLSCLLINTSSK